MVIEDHAGAPDESKLCTDTRDAKIASLHPKDAVETCGSHLGFERHGHVRRNCSH